MATILHSEVFSHSGKTYRLDVLQHASSAPFVRITETVHEGPRRGRHLVELDAGSLKRIIAFLEAAMAPAPANAPLRKRPFFTGVQCDAMKRSYLKGVTSAALAVQYGCTAEDIEEVLRAEGVEVVDQTLPAMRKPRSVPAGKSRAGKGKAKGAQASVSQAPQAWSDAPWSAADDVTLANLHRRGASIRGLVSKFNRPPSFISAKLQKLGLT